MRYYSSISVDTALTAGVSADATSLPVSAIVGYPSQFPFTLVIDPDTAKEELCDVTGYAGLAFTVTRGVDSTLPVAHDAGAKIKHVASGRDFRETQQHMADTALHVPDQSGQVGKFLSTDGSSASWQTVTIPDADTVTTSLMLGGM